MATGVTDQQAGEQRQLSPEDLSFLQGALASACDTGASTKQMHSALARLHQFICTGAVGEEHDDDDDVAETVDALELLRDEFDDLNKTAVLTHTQSGALEMLLWLWDQHYQSVLLEGDDAPSTSEERRAHALEIVERRGWGSNVPQAIRKAAITTLAAALYSNPPVQNLLGRFGFLERVLAQLRVFDASTASSGQADVVLRLVGGLSSYTSNHAGNEKALIDSRGLALLLPWVTDRHPRLATKILFLFRNILRHNPQPDTFPAEFPGHLANYLSIVVESPSNETLAEMVAAFLEEASAIAAIRAALLQAIVDKEAVKASLFGLLTELESNQDRQDEREHIKALYNNLFASE